VALIRGSRHEKRILVIGLLVVAVLTGFAYEVQKKSVPQQARALSG